MSAGTEPVPRRARAVSGDDRVPNVDHERWLWEHGFERVAGVDEAGRGALAGPLVAAAVVLPPCSRTPNLLGALRDSKLLSPTAREELRERVEALALGIGIAVIPAPVLDAAGLAAAGQLALCRAVAGLDPPPDFILADAYRLREAPAPQLALIHGDTRCLSIAAASVVAKVTRDHLMAALHVSFPDYAFDRHKGYGTTGHRDRLTALGPCSEHRRSYAPVRLQCVRTG
jgi:ribonuclease HII